MQLPRPCLSCFFVEFSGAFCHVGLFANMKLILHRVRVSRVSNHHWLDPQHLASSYHLRKRYYASRQARRVQILRTTDRNITRWIDKDACKDPNLFLQCAATECRSRTSA